MTFLMVLRRMTAWMVLMVVMGSCFGCEYMPFGYTPLRDIVSNPATYEGKEIKVKGTVNEVTKIPFMDAKFYTLTQDGSQIIVMTEAASPALNKQITVVGTVKNVAIFGNESIGLHILEIKRVDTLF